MRLYAPNVAERKHDSSSAISTTLHSCHQHYMLSCALAEQMVIPFVLRGITWDSMKGHKGLFLSIDHRSNQLFSSNQPTTPVIKFGFMPVTRKDFEN